MNIADFWKTILAIVAVVYLGYLYASEPHAMGGRSGHRVADVTAGANGNSEKSLLFVLPFAICGVRLLSGDDGCTD